MEFDVIIIGAGVVGCAIARELAKTDLRVAVLEKEPDVCEGTSKANSGIVHAGYDAVPGTLKARMNVQGAAMIPELASCLGFDWLQTGSLVLCFDEDRRPDLEALLQRGRQNGVKDLEILEGDRLRQLEPRISPEAVCGLWAPGAGIVDPFGMTVAFAENAAANGVTFFFDAPVQTIEKTKAGWRVNDSLEARALVNAAGVCADVIHNLACPDRIRLRARKGEYFLFDREAGSVSGTVLFQQPDERGKGVLVTPTVHGNLLAGPTAKFVTDREETATTAAGLQTVRAKASWTIPDLPWNQVITSFAGLRAVPEGGDFILQESAPGFFDAAGIESPGLTSAPAIGAYIAGLVKERLQPGPNPDYLSRRRPFANVKRLDSKAWNALIEQDPAYGRIVCRCETITEGEIRDACTRDVPARTLDGVKRRVRAGMGRCQGGFCMPKVMEILAEVQGIPIEEVRKSGPASFVLCPGEDGKERL